MNTKYNIDVSVVVVNYNGKKYIDKLLASLQNQISKNFTYEIVFVDNNSADDSVKYIQQHWADKIKNLRVVESKENFIQYVKCNNHLTKSDIMALIILYKRENNIFNNNDEAILELIKNAYKQEFNEEIFSEPVTDDNEMVFPENIKDYVNIITDRILSAKDGFAKLKFIINELNNFYSEDSNKR